MKSKIRDTWEELRGLKKIEQQMWRQLKPKLREKGMENKFNEIWAEEKDRLYKELKLKKNKKIKWIKNKYYKKDKIPDIIEGVIVKDQEVGEEFEMKTTTYGGIQLTSDEESVMKLHPKYTVFDKVDPVDCEAEIEKAMAKIRWARMEDKKDERNETNDTPDGRTESQIEREVETQRDDEPDEEQHNTQDR